MSYMTELTVSDLNIKSAFFVHDGPQRPPEDIHGHPKPFKLKTPYRGVAPWSKSFTIIFMQGCIHVYLLGEFASFAESKALKQIELPIVSKQICIQSSKSFTISFVVECTHIY